MGEILGRRVVAAEEDRGRDETDEYKIAGSSRTGERLPALSLGEGPLFAGGLARRA
jgi:hypothetical protein